MRQRRHHLSEGGRRLRVQGGRHRLRQLAPVLALLAALAPAPGCFDVIALRPELRAAAVRQDALEVSDALERLIDRQEDQPHDREAAYDAVRQWSRPTAEYAFARAALAGRLAQIRGLTAVSLVREAERWALYSMRMDPKLRGGAAKRMLGTLYVLAPASMLEHGDSEEGLQMLEELCETYPADPRNRLRLAEAYISLSDPEPAHEHLCKCLADRAKLRPSDQRLLDQLVAQIGKKNLDC